MSETFEVDIKIQSTPNPNAWKFILDRPVLLEGKATYSIPDDCHGNRLAWELLHIEGIKHIHFFSNVITVTQTFDAEIDRLHAEVMSVIKTRMPAHNPHNTVMDYKKQAREALPTDLRQIEEILDETIRPGLQGDGGDIEVIKYEDKKLYVSYQGACGTCPSSTTGTLMAIEGILKEQFDPSIEVIPM